MDERNVQACAPTQRVLHSAAPNNTSPRHTHLAMASEPANGRRVPYATIADPQRPGLGAEIPGGNLHVTVCENLPRSNCGAVRCLEGSSVPTGIWNNPQSIGETCYATSRLPR